MSLTVLLAPDASLVTWAPGLLSLPLFLTVCGQSPGLREAVAPSMALRPGYRLEHHDLAELLTERTRCLDAIQATAKLAEDRVATETAALRRERDGLVAWLAQVPSLSSHLVHCAHESGMAVPRWDLLP
jgi:hypothetical protein